MKTLAFLFNVVGIVLCIYLYQHLGAMVFAVIGLIPLITLIVLSGLTRQKFIRVVMILNLCLSCAAIIVILVLLFHAAVKEYPFSPAVTFTLISTFFAMAVVNMVILKKISG